MFSNLRKRVDRLCCQEDFDAFLSHYSEFSTALKQNPSCENVLLISDAELIRNADYLDRMGERLEDMLLAAENMKEVSSNIESTYKNKLKTYRQDWWKLQGLLVLAGRANECTLCTEYPDDLRVVEM